MILFLTGDIVGAFLYISRLRYAGSSSCL